MKFCFKFSTLFGAKFKFKYGGVVRRINLSQDIKSLSDFRANAALYVRNIRRSKRPMVITQNGKSSAVILDVNDYESLLEKIDLLQDVQISRKQLANGEGVDHDSAKEMILSKLSI